MPTLKELSKKLDISEENLKVKISALGFEVKDDRLDDVTSELVVAELQSPANSAKVYEDLFEREQTREIIKTQRKMTAGKLETGKTKKTKKPVEKAKSAVPQPAAVLPQPVAEKSKSSFIEIPDTITVKEFGEKTGISPVKIIGELMKNGILANINQQIDFETCSIIAHDFKIPLKRKRSKVLLEDLESANLEALLMEHDEADLQPRPAIVTIMGHVDHGKSKLLECIRNVEMLSLEAGGITQHIGAYQVEKNGKKITFLDTPGHEAFTAMRARGAKVTDIAILVVAADEGIKAQTIEAIHHAQDADIPIIVAMNKMDKEGANVDRLKGQLAEHGLQPEEWGGKTVMVPISALTGMGIPTLLEMILLVAEMGNLRANPNRDAVGTVIEANMDKSLGPVATVVVNTGTLHIGDFVVVGETFGKVKLMKDFTGKLVKLAGPSDPVLIAGLSAVPAPGSILQAVEAEKEAREKAMALAQRRQILLVKKVDTLSAILAKIAAGELKTLKVVLKTDNNGSLEAIKVELEKIKSSEVALNIIHSGVGDISESDVMMAKASEGVVVGFHVNSSSHVRQMASREGIQIFTYTIIYKLAEDLKDLLSGLLAPEIIIHELGKAEVRQVFFSGKRDIIIGAKVMSGKLEAKAHARVMREGKEVGEGIISSLKKVAEAVHEIAEGHECGIKFEGTVKPVEGDILEAWKQETKKRTL